MSMTPPHVTDRRLNLLVIAAAVTAVAFVIFALVAGPKILASASTTQAIKRGDELTACRAGYRIDVDDAAARLQTARARLDSLTNEGLEASVRDDRARLAELVLELRPARQAVEDGADRLTRTTERYRKLVELSRKNPTRFIELCRVDQ